ncbi:MAG: T9SS type A sorting domain-containing protein [Candidatus Marinimicrobia bacterium]|nr:T9SS type A sorting domain-containing protein [Candidatus Neomarinimicrobiota bacterium]
MRKMLIILLSLFMFAGLFAGIMPPTPPATFDLAIPSRYDFTDEEIDVALDAYRTIYENWLETPGLYSKGQTGLMILDMFALRDTLIDAAEFQGMLIFDQVYEIFDALWYLGESLYFITDSVDNQYDLIDNLYAFMTEGRADSLLMLKDSLIVHMQDTYEMTMNNLANTVYELFVFGDSLGTRFDTIRTLGEDFTFRIGEVEITSPGSLVPPVPPVYDTTEVAVIYDETFQSIWAAVKHIENATMYLGAGIKYILEDSATVAVGLDTLMMAMNSFQAVCDTLNNYSIWSIIDTTWSINDSVEIGFEDIKDGFAEVEAVLGGKTYFIHTEADSIEIKPVAIIENMHYGLYRTYIDMYWQEDPFTYTFRDIFPSGLPVDIIDQLQPDIILNPQDTPEELETYLGRMLGLCEEGSFLDSTNIDAHTGAGYLKLFFMFKDIQLQGETIAALVDGGRIDSLFQNYDWTNLDYTDEIDEIRHRLSKQVNEFYDNDSTVLYTVLIKDPYKSSPGHDVVEGDFVYPVYIIPQATEAVLIASYMVEDAITAVKDGIEYVYTQVDSMIDITLDPNLLDLSNIEEPLDLIYALETSNPNFGAFTPMGKLMFAQFGDNLAEAMVDMGDLADTVIATVDYAGPLLGEFGMTEEDHDTLLMGLGKARMMIGMFAADLSTPEVYTIIDKDTLNLSAWFDNVPDNMLAVWKNYFEGTDSSLAGFFPMKMINPGIDPSYVPAEFALKGNYPNPFNPLTTIAFDLPSDGMVNMTVFNITGRQVAKLIDRQSMQAGSYELTWNAADYSSGVYIVRAQYGTEVAYQKMTLLK